MVKPGDIVRVKVLEVDKPRKRIALTLRLDDQAGSQPARSARTEGGGASRRDKAAPAARQGRFPGQRDGRRLAAGRLRRAQVSALGERARMLRVARSS